jgi:hypothetical protein
MKVCSVDGCEKKHLARGLCGTHYNQQHCPDRHKKVDIPCDQCGAVVSKPKTSRFANRFCDLTCRDMYRMEHGGTGPNGHPIRPLRCPIPKGHPVRALMRDQQRADRIASQPPRESVHRNPRFVAGLCEMCKQPFVGRWLNSASPTVCSDKCGKRKARHQRRAALQAAEYVEAVTWQILAERDGLGCYICGIDCDPHDCKWVEGRDGRMAFKVGPTFPTHDHVHPISRGGAHSMANARLACADCNSHKADAA